MQIKVDIHQKNLLDYFMIKKIKHIQKVMQVYYQIWLNQDKYHKENYHQQYKKKLDIFKVEVDGKVYNN